MCISTTDPAFQRCFSVRPRDYDLTIRHGHIFPTNLNDYDELYAIVPSFTVISFSFFCFVLLLFVAWEETFVRYCIDTLVEMSAPVYVDIALDLSM
jgi:hypothetical protein